MGSGVSLISEIESVRRHSRENSLPKDSEGVEHFVASNGDKVPISSLRVPAAEIEEFEKLQLASREKLSILRNLDIFVLDNTVRETTVAQPRGHTQEDKFRILDMVHRCGFRDCVVAAFGTLERVDDAFVQALVKSGADMATNWAFSEVYEGYQDGVPLKDIPQGLQRMQRYRIQNAILERDFNCAQTAWGSAWQEEEEADMLVQRVEWVRENLGGRALINIRDFSEACADNLPRVLYIVERLAGMPSKPFGLIFEEPSGTIFPFEFSAVVRIVRQKVCTSKRKQARRYLFFNAKSNNVDDQLWMGRWAVSSSHTPKLWACRSCSYGMSRSRCDRYLVCNLLGRCRNWTRV